MGILSRLHRVTVAHIESLLSSIEDPETVFPQLVREMEDRVRLATEAEAKAAALVKSAERERDEWTKKIERYGRGAELAMSKGDEVTARDAVNAQLEAEQALVRKEDAVKRAQDALALAKQARLEMGPQLEELRNKKEEILARAAVAKNQKRVLKTVSGKATSARSILDEASRMEGSVEQVEAEMEVQRDLTGHQGQASLDSRLKGLEKTASVEERLAALKTGAKP